MVVFYNFNFCYFCLKNYTFNNSMNADKFTSLKNITSE